MYEILQSTTSKNIIYGVQSVEIQVLIAVLFWKECYNLMWFFFLMFILKEKLINSILIKIWLVLFVPLLCPQGIIYL